MSLSYILSYVEVSTAILSFDSVSGITLKGCSPQLRQFADHRLNARAVDDYEEWQFALAGEAAFEAELDLLVAESFPYSPWSDDY